MDIENLARRVELRVRTITRLLRAEAPYGTSVSALLVLSTLQDRGPSRVTTLAEIADVTQPTMTALVTRLEKSKLVTRRRDAKDGRAMEVSITPAGGRRIEEVLSLRAGVLTERLKQLDAEQIAALDAALNALGIVAGLDDDEESHFQRI